MPDEKELGPIEKLVRGHVTLENEAKSVRIRIGKGKWAQSSIEQSLAKDYGFQMHRGFWVLMEKVPCETVDEDGEMQKSFQLVLPAYAVEAFKQIEAAANKPVENLTQDDQLAANIVAKEVANNSLPQSV